MPCRCPIRDTSAGSRAAPRLPGVGRDLIDGMRRPTLYAVPCEGLQILTGLLQGAAQEGGPAHG